jgi:hypothetical protein
MRSVSIFAGAFCSCHDDVRCCLRIASSSIFRSSCPGERALAEGVTVAMVFGFPSLACFVSEEQTLHTIDGGILIPACDRGSHLKISLTVNVLLFSIYK